MAWQLVYFFSFSLDACNGISACIATGKNFYWDNVPHQPDESMSFADIINDINIVDGSDSDDNDCNIAGLMIAMMSLKELKKSEF